MRTNIRLGNLLKDFLYPHNFLLCGFSHKVQRDYKVYHANVKKICEEIEQE
jgi:hypothetical protein